MGHLKRKRYCLDQAIVKKAQKLLHAKSESKAIEKALELAVFQKEAAKVWRENAGRGGIEVFYAK